MTAPPIAPAHEVDLEAALFSEPDANLYVALDGASIPSLLPRLEGDAPEHVCLYRLEPGSEIAQVAPYLVRLERGAEFTNWLLANCPGRHWGIFIVSDADLELLRRRLRKMTLVDDDRHRTLLFRFYDPRVLNEYIFVFDGEQLTQAFGVIQAYFAEASEAGTQWNKYTVGKDGLEHQVLQLVGI